jgi:hypothetical protein
MRKVIGWLGVAIIVCVVIAGVIAYFVFSYDPQTKVAFDGFGRQLYESPWFVRLIFGEDRLWSGWTWFTDMIIFWGGIDSVLVLAGWGLRTKLITLWLTFHWSRLHKQRRLSSVVAQGNRSLNVMPEIFLAIAIVALVVPALLPIYPHPKIVKRKIEQLTLCTTTE